MQFMQKEPIKKMHNKIITFFSRSKLNPDITIDKANQKVLDTALRDECNGIVMNNNYASKKIFGLLKAGANPDAKDSDSMTPLIYAAWGGDSKIVKAMLVLGAEVDAQDNKGMTAFMLAAQCGHLRAVRVLLANGADINAKAKDGRTALMMAAENGHVRVCRLLMKNGANPNITNGRGKNARIIAINNNHWKTAALLSKSIIENFKNMMGKKSFKSFMLNFRECVNK
jgi:ankyrin repeat protein